MSILLESQSIWSMNILIRAFFYLADTYKRYFNKIEQDLYHPKKEVMPEPKIPAEELTVSIFRERYPKKLLEELTASEEKVQMTAPGVVQDC